MIDHAPRLAITMGDPAGVGPEIIVKACRRLLPRIEAGGLRLLVIGHRSALHAAQTVLNETLAFAEAEDVPLGFPCGRGGS
jgi:4-hydroxythreonine-4-phosphate dehydrogenase